ncbi:hypothetical protein UlMin_042972 [Ulmus minor]
MDISKKGPGQNKRFWTVDEDIKLVEALLEIHNEGKFKAQGNFKPGHLKANEKYLEVKLPGCELKAKPHIESRMKTLKTQFYVVHEMLTGPNYSGFGWDSDRKMVTAEKPIWDAYLLSHKDAAPYKTKAFPFYDELCLVFGKDRATGKDSENIVDATEEIQRLGINNDMSEDNINNIENMGFADAENSKFMSQSRSDGSSKRKKRSKSTDDLGESIKEAAFSIAKEMKDSFTRLSEAMIDKGMNERQMGVNDELMRTTWLNMLEMHKAALLITRDTRTLNAFTSVNDDEKDVWVRALLDGLFWDEEKKLLFSLLLNLFLVG